MFEVMHAFETPQAAFVPHQRAMAMMTCAAPANVQTRHTERASPASLAKAQPAHTGHELQSDALLKTKSGHSTNQTVPDPVHFCISSLSGSFRTCGAV
jgi:hypothetical protein